VTLPLASLRVVDEAAVIRWLSDYVAAWQSYDPDTIGELFSEDAEYRYHPWDEAVRGRDAIVASWLEEPDEQGSWTAEYHPWIAEGDRAVAVGVSRYLAADRATVESEYHNVFLLAFDNDGRCREFTELYMSRPA
jgi:ketosteroid isomerase-like protein